MRDNTVGFLRLLAGVLGPVLIVGSILAEPLGLGSRGISPGQVCIALVGCVLLWGAIAGRSFPGSYRGAGTILLSVLLLFIVLEGAALVLATVLGRAGLYDPGVDPERGVLDTPGNLRYRPYVMWRHRSMSEPGTTVNAEGIRITPRLYDAQDALKVFVFGGSTVWGFGVQDTCTIPFYIQQRLTDELDRPVAVTNFGQNMYVSTQSLIELEIQLQAGNVPDAVVFYDGVNDIFGAYPHGRPGYHYNHRGVSHALEGTSGCTGTEALRAILGSSSLVQLLQHWLGPPPAGGEERVTRAAEEFQGLLDSGLSSDSLAAGIVGLYASNARMVRALGAEYGFDCLFIWQPHALAGHKELSTEELQRVSAEDPNLETLFNAAYREAAAAADTTEGWYYIADMFGDTSVTVYADVCHLNALGNRMVADTITALLSSRLRPE